MDRVSNSRVPEEYRGQTEVIVSFQCIPYTPKTDGQRQRVARGARVFVDTGCAKCHDPNQGYTNNKLVRAPGFQVPDDHPEKANIIARSVGTDPTLVMQTRRGTGLYKIPSLKGVWYRGPFEHNGSVATLDDWFDPKRLNDGYVATGWTGRVSGRPGGIDRVPENALTQPAHWRQDSNFQQRLGWRHPSL